MLDFPNSPIAGQQFTAAGVTWTFDGAKWLPSGLSPLVVPGSNDNRIINGDMRIDQRNNGASGSGGYAYTVDRWSYNVTQIGKGTWQRVSSGGLAGFPYALAFASLSAYTPVAADLFEFMQPIEADMVSDLAWGTPNAQPVTLSFWAQSTLTGKFSGSVRGANRSYPFTYSLPTANNWTKITITIPGDTGGPWTMSGNGLGVEVGFSLGAGSTYTAPANAWSASGYGAAAPGSVQVVSTNGAVFYVTGVKLEIGNVATPFNRQSLAKSMADCQRYYFSSAYGGATTSHKIQNYAVVPGITSLGTLYHPVSMRGGPSINFTNITYANCSALTLDGFLASNAAALYVTATAAGVVSATFAYTASAEL